MINTILMLQSFGCGDIIFENSIANDFVDEGYKVIWPVDAVYAPLAKHFPNITMIDKQFVNVDWNRKDDYVINGTRVIPMRFADHILKVPYTQCMSSKYTLLGKDWTKWKDNCKIVRFWEREVSLYYGILGLEECEKYNLISEVWGTGGNRKNPIVVDNGLKNVYARFIEGFTLIDWLMVFENATNIHAVSSSNIYLFELYEMKAEEINLYIRKPIETNHDNYSYLLKRHKYVLHP